MILYNGIFINIKIISGNFYNRIYVVGFTETVSEANETECQEITIASLEAMVHTNFIST